MKNEEWRMVYEEWRMWWKGIMKVKIKRIGTFHKVKLYYRFSVIIFGASSAKRAMFMPSLLTHKAKKSFWVFNFYPAILRQRLNRSMVSIQRGCGKGLAESRLRPLRNAIGYSIAHDQIVATNGFLYNPLIISNVQNTQILRYFRQSQWKFWIREE